jgi:hypothetical protein
MQIPLKNIVDSYIKKYQADELRELEFFCREASFIRALENAALAVDCSGKRQKHQRRLQLTTLQKGRNALLSVRKRIQHARDFGELHNIIREAVSPIKGLGELYVYDTALRIGAHLNLWPSEVYLHSGTRQGARALGYIGAGPLQVSELPKEFQRLPAYQIEDVLCIYKRFFRKNVPLTNPEVVCRELHESKGCT